MTSLLWLGQAMHCPEGLASLRGIPVREWLLPWPKEPDECPGEHSFYHLPECSPAFLERLLTARDIYFLAVEDFRPIMAVLPYKHGRLLALGQIPPPSPVEFMLTSPERIAASLLKELPSPENNTFYITGGELRCSVDNEDYDLLLERMQGK